LAQLAPLRVKVAGTPLPPVEEPFMPKLTLPPAGMVSVHGSWVARS
jgi:hypothetical protein